MHYSPLIYDLSLFSCCLQVLSVPFYTWSALQSQPQATAYLEQLLQSPDSSLPRLSPPSHSEAPLHHQPHPPRHLTYPSDAQSLGHGYQPSWGMPIGAIANGHAAYRQLSADVHPMGSRAFAHDLLNPLNSQPNWIDTALADRFGLPLFHVTGPKLGGCSCLFCRVTAAQCTLEASSLLAVIMRVCKDLSREALH